MINQGLQLIRNGVDVIKIMSIEQCVSPNLQAYSSDVEINQTGRQMRSAWMSGDIGQKMTLLKHVGHVELAGVDWI